MKSSAIGVQEVMYAFLGIVFVVFIFLLASGTLGGLGGFSDFWSNLLGGDLTGEDPDYLIAKNSVEALACAINSVGSGRELACVDDFTSSTATAGFGTGFFAGARAQESKEKPTVSCTCNYPEIEYEESRNFPSGRRDNVIFKYENGEWKWKSPDMGKETYIPVKRIYLDNFLRDVDPVYEIILGKMQYDPKGLMLYYNDFGKGIEVFQEAVKSSISDGDDKVKVRLIDDKTELQSFTINKDSIDTLPDVAKHFCLCAVDNFQLPQEVTKWEDVIPFLGDPNLIAYWNVFPSEEDTWNTEINWMTHGIIAVVSIIPLGRAGGLGFRAAWNALRGSKGYAAEQLIKLYGKEQVNQWKKQGVKKFARDMYIKKVGKRYLMKQYLKEKSKESILQGYAKHLVNPNPANLRATLTKLGVVTKFASLEIAAYALADSKMKKYEPAGNNLVLAIPFKELEPSKIVDDLETGVVLVKWNPGSIFGGRTYKNLHLVSPCHLKEFSISKEFVKCKQYTITPGEDVVSCHEPEETENMKLPSCSSFDKEQVDKQLGIGVYDKAMELVGKSRKLFQYNIETDELERIYFPLHSTQTKSLYMEVNLLREEEIHGSGFVIYKKYYNYTMKQEGEGDDIISGDIDGEMECTRSVVHIPILSSDELKNVNECKIQNTEIEFEFNLVSEEFDTDEGPKKEIIVSMVYVNQDVNFVDFIELKDGNDLNDEWDTLHLADQSFWEQHFTSSVINPPTSKSIVFEDIDSDGNYISATKTNCRTEAVIADLGGLGLTGTMEKIEGDNYCIRHKSKSGTIIRAVGKGIGVAALIAAGPFSGGSTWAVLLTGAAVGIGWEAMEISADYDQMWPG